MAVAIMDNKLIYCNSNDDSLFEFKDDIKNDDSFYILLGMFFIYFFKYFWTSNPVGKCLYSISSNISNFMIVIIAVILTFYGLIRKEKDDKRNIGLKINIVDYEKFFQAFDEYTKSCIFALCKLGFAFLIIILPTLFENEISLLNAILCIFGIYYLINAIFDLNFFKRKRIYKILLMTHYENIEFSKFSPIDKSYGRDDEDLLSD